MKIFKTETKTIQVVTDFVCNLCGESCREIGASNSTEVSVDAHGCYDSWFPPDLEVWSLELCEACFGFLVSRMKIAPFAAETTLDGDILAEVDSGEGTIEGLLRHGLTDPSKYQPHVLALYAKAMSRGELFIQSDLETLAFAAAKAAGNQVTKTQEKYGEEFIAVSKALDALGVPDCNGMTLAHRARILQSSGVDDRLVDLIRVLCKHLRNRILDSGARDMEEAVAVDQAEAFLGERDSK